MCIRDRSDDNGGSDVATAQVSVRNVPPAVDAGADAVVTLPDAFSWAGIALITISGVVVARAQAGRTVLRRQPKI